MAGNDQVNPSLSDTEDISPDCSPPTEDHTPTLSVQEINTRLKAFNDAYDERKRSKEDHTPVVMPVWDIILEAIKHVIQENKQAREEIIKENKQSKEELKKEIQEVKKEKKQINETLNNMITDAKQANEKLKGRYEQSFEKLDQRLKGAVEESRTVTRQIEEKCHAMEINIGPETEPMHAEANILDEEVIKQASERETCMEDQPTENVKTGVAPHPAERREGPADVARQAEDDIDRMEGQPVPPRADYQESKDVARRVEEQPGPPTAHVTVHPPKTASTTDKTNIHEDRLLNNRKTETHNNSKSQLKVKTYKSKQHTGKITFQRKRRSIDRIHLHRRHIRLKSYIKLPTSMQEKRKVVSRRAYNHRSHVRLKSNRLYTGMQKRKRFFEKTHKHHRHVRFKKIKLHVTGKQRRTTLAEEIYLLRRHIRFKPSLIKRIVANWNGNLEINQKSNLDGGLRRK